MNAKDTMLLWNPQTGDVLLQPWPDADHQYRSYRSGLACYAIVTDASFEQRKMYILVEAMHLIVRDGIDPIRLHHCLLGLDEYRDACADDMPGVDQLRGRRGEA